MTNDKIAEEIARLETRIAQLKRITIEDKQKMWRKHHGVRVVCRRCYGKGVVVYGADIMEMDQDICDPCRGRGWLIAVEFDDPLPHNIDEIIAEIDERSLDYDI